MRNLNCVLLSVLFFFIPMAALAGDLDSPAAPTDAASAMYTLEAIYNRLDAGTAGAKRAGAFTEPSAGPTAGTGRTLDDVMGKAPSVDAANGAGMADVLATKTFWGLKTGGWGLLTGTMPTNTLSADNDTVSAGYYAATTLSAVDADLTAPNIVSGKTIFGKVGTAIAATGDAEAGDVLTGHTFSKTGAAGVSGTMPDKEGDNASTAQAQSGGVNFFTAPAGYYDGGDRVSATDAQVAALDTDVVTDNIKNTVTIFGVIGTYEGESTAPVAKTGQTPTVPLNLAPDGSDGNLQKGVAWPSPKRFSNNGDGTVTDNLTGLIWLQDAECFGLRTWATALSDCNGLASGTCSLNDSSIATDWRLPNVKELQSLIDFAYYNPALSNDAGTGHWTTGDDSFTGVQWNKYWSSTTTASDPSNKAFAVDLGSGDVLNSHKRDATHYVWPVRGGQ